MNATQTRRPSPRPTTARDTALGTPHSTPAPDPGGNRAARAGARARVPSQTALTQGNQPASFPPATRGAVDDARGLRERLADYWRPPIVWTEPPASLADICSYARTGEWTTVDGPWRIAGVAWSWLALAISVPLYYTAWMIQRPGRAVTGLILYALLAHTPVGGWLPWPDWA